VNLRIPASGSPIPHLSIRTERADLIDAQTPRPRLVGARITALRFVEKRGSRNP
jgi:hypothetical protein